MGINTVFQQLQQFIPRAEFEEIVSRYGGDRYTKKFTTLNQLMVLLYAQSLTKDSLRDIESSLSVHLSSLYHLNIKTIAKSTVGRANNNRDCRIFEDLYHSLLSRCSNLTSTKKFQFSNEIYALDSTTISLCLTLFPWSKFRQKGAVKMHNLLNLRTQVPDFTVITEANKADITIAKDLDLKFLRDSITVIDRGYVDTKWLSDLDSNGAFFVTREKSNMVYTVLGQHKCDPADELIYSDEIIKFTGNKTNKQYPKELRRIEWLDKEKETLVVFLTNNFELPSDIIADIYRSRWQIELFFKWIKQNLKIKTFLGNSFNAVKTQIWVAMIYYLLLLYIKFQTKYDGTLLLFSRIIREALFMKVHIVDLLSINLGNIKNLKPPESQMDLFPNY